MNLLDMFKGGGLGVAAEGADWWKDPNLMSILLGQMGQAAMGPYQDTWQSRLGGTAAQMGTSAKFQTAARKREQELMQMLSKAFGAFTPKGQPGMTEAKIASDGTVTARGELPVDQSGLIDMGTGAGGIPKLFGARGVESGRGDYMFDMSQPDAANLLKNYFENFRGAR